MHKAAVALMAVPILVAVYLGALVRRSILARVGLAFGVALVLGIGVISAGQPSTTIANPPTTIVPLTEAAFTTTFATDRGVTEPVTIEFTTPMDRVSVAAAVRVEPTTPVALAWDATDTVLTIAPKVRWAPGSLHTVTVEAGALAQSGQPLARPARAAFLTRNATTGSAVATLPVGLRVSIDTAFLVKFARPVDQTTVEAAIRLEPPTPGVVQASNPADGPIRYTFVPAALLRPNVEYRLVVSGVLDLDGIALDTFALAVRTTTAPAVVRFRPRADTKDIARDAAISVRFTESMERRSTARAFSVSVSGAPIAGKIRWAESDTVLVFSPTAQLPYGTTVSMDVTEAARSVAGVTLAATSHGVFQTVAKPVPAPAAAKATKPKPPVGGATTPVGGGSWASVETYYLGLMNCTRTGGWVTSTGHCSSPGGRAVAPLKLDKGISSRVSRPYAKKLAVGNDCSHFIGGNPGDRLRRAGYTSYRWAENLGCRSGAAKAAVLGSHLFFQSERSYNGGHYVNMMNAKYDRVGIGVWVYGGRVRLVVDFYHP